MVDEIFKEVPGKSSLWFKQKGLRFLYFILRDPKKHLGPLRIWSDWRGRHDMANKTKTFREHLQISYCDLWDFDQWWGNWPKKDTNKEKDVLRISPKKNPREFLMFGHNAKET